MSSGGNRNANAGRSVGGSRGPSQQRQTATATGNRAGSVAAAATSAQQQQQQPTTTAAQMGVSLPRNVLDNFSRVYQNLVASANIVEQDAKNTERIVEANYAIYRLISGFLQTVRNAAADQPASGTKGGVRHTWAFVSAGDVNVLETERELRLLRAVVARNAATSGLGQTFLASVDPQSLKDKLRAALTTLNDREEGDGGGGGGGENAEAADEEKNPMKVKLDKADGLYAIRDTSEALDVNELVGYKNEALELISYCRNVNFVLPAASDGDGGGGGGAGQGTGRGATAVSSRNPICLVLYGPPGTGKTTIAQSIAKYLDCVYMYVNAENVISQWAGGTEKNIAKLFRRARIASLQNQGRKTLMLIDEIDGLLKNRATNPSMTGEEYSRITTFLQMLTPPTGVNSGNIITVFTTNRLENVDAAVINRCRGRIFMGYVASPEDRAKLIWSIFGDYVRQPMNENELNALYQAAVYNDDLVPRDLQNVLAQVKNQILARYANVPAQQDLVIDLKQNENRVTAEELVGLLNGATPATPVDVYFRDYSPPLTALCLWMALNDQFVTKSKTAITLQANERCNR